MKAKKRKLSADRKAILKYLRDVADMYAYTPMLGYDEDTRGPVSHCLDACIRDIKAHPDTFPKRAKRKAK